MTDREIVFACNMQAIKPEQRPKHIAAIETVFGAVSQVRDLENGYSFLLGNEEAVQHVWEFIRLERLCCPFFRFTVAVEADGGPVSLVLEGPSGVKPFIQAEIGSHLSASLMLPKGFIRYGG